jgi:hypothetical protein
MPYGPAPDGATDVSASSGGAAAAALDPAAAPGGVGGARM